MSPYWWSIEVLDGPHSFAGPRRDAHQERLDSAAIPFGASAWTWPTFSSGVLSELTFNDAATSTSGAEAGFRGLPASGAKAGSRGLTAFGAEAGFRGLPASGAKAGFRVLPASQASAGSRGLSVSEAWCSFRGFPAVRAALDTVPDSVNSLLIVPGRGGRAGCASSRRPRLSSGAGVGVGAAPMPRDQAPQHAGLASAESATITGGVTV